MSPSSRSPTLRTSEQEPPTFGKDSEKIAEDDSAMVRSLSIGSSEDILGLQDIDPALNAKMRIVNDVSQNQLFRLLYNNAKGH